MKILAVHSALSQDINKQSQVDHWRIYRPLRELAKHVDWQIDHTPTYIPGFDKYKNLDEFTDIEMNKALNKICQYDVVYSSYHADAAAYTLLKVAHDKAGTKFVMDMDDDIFTVNEDNPYWLKMDDKKTWVLQVMVRENPWVTTTNEYLANQFRRRRAKDPDNHPRDTVIVLPNYISNDYKPGKFDNGDKIVIGYFGGSSHYDDLHETNIAEALKDIMHKHKNVYFKAVGMPLDKYVPRARYSFQEGKRGTKWLDDIFPTLNMDIALAPLADNQFNLSKSDIKWQEATRAGAVVVASDIGPYNRLPDGLVLKTKNTYAGWLESLRIAIENKSYREKLLKSSQEHLKTMTIEKNWKMYKDMFERVNNG